MFVVRYRFIVTHGLYHERTPVELKEIPTEVSSFATSVKIFFDSTIEESPCGITINQAIFVKSYGITDAAMTTRAHYNPNRRAGITVRTIKLNI